MQRHAEYKITLKVSENVKELLFLLPREHHFSWLNRTCRGGKAARGVSCLQTHVQPNMERARVQGVDLTHGLPVWTETRPLITRTLL